MKFLRTVSTQRLLAIIAGVIIAVVAGTAIAVAASNGGPTPRKESLATALHQAAGAPAVDGITARIQFTNNLIDSSDLQGTDPILNGATGRLWISNNGQLRLELQGDNGDAQVVVNNGTFSIYDPMSNTVYKGTLPQHSGSVLRVQERRRSPRWRRSRTTSTSLRRTGTWSARPRATWPVSPPTRSGSRPSTTAACSAASSSPGTPSRGIPLGIAIYSNSSSTPVLELKATSISYGAVTSHVFAIKAPAGAHVVSIGSLGGGASATGAMHAHKAGKGKAGKADAQATTPAQVQAKLPFTLAAPGNARRPDSPVGFGCSTGAAARRHSSPTARASAGSP